MNIEYDEEEDDEYIDPDFLYAQALSRRVS